MLGHILVRGVGRAGVGLVRAARRPRTCVGRSAILGSRAVGRGCGIGVVQILRVALPTHARLVELVEQRRHRGRVDAAVLARGCVGARRGGELPVVGIGAQTAAVVDGAGHGVVVGTVSLRIGHRRLTGGHRQVVVLGEVAGAVVVLQKDALGREGLPQVGVVVEPGERGVVGLVLENDQEHVLDLARPDPEPVEVFLATLVGAPAQSVTRGGGQLGDRRRRSPGVRMRTSRCRRRDSERHADAHRRDRHGAEGEQSTAPSAPRPR